MHNWLSTNKRRRRKGNERFGQKPIKIKDKKIK
jgi:hypothetical protein